MSGRADWGQTTQGKRHLSRLVGVLLVGDQIMLHGAFVLAFLLRYAGTLPAYNFVPYLQLSPWISALFLLYGYAYQLYSSRPRRWADEFTGVILTVLLTILSSVGLSYFAYYFAFPRTVFAIATGLQIVILSGWRWFMHRRFLQPAWRQRLLVVGEPVAAAELAAELSRYGEVAGIVVPEGEEATPAPAAGAVPVLGSWSRIEEIVETVQPEAVVLTAGLSEEAKARLVNLIVRFPVAIRIIPSVYDILLASSRLTQMEDIPLYEIQGPLLTGQWVPAKRLLDVILAGVGLLVVAPLLLVVAAAVRLDSRGPVLYTQKRLTEGGREFVLYKFRTMVKGAEALSGPVLASRDDPRVTRVGKILRATRLDELPQLYNVLRGDLSLIGPRPERPFFVRRHLDQIPGYQHRLQVKGGITGLAQVAGRYSTPTEQKLLFDLIYARSCSPLMDLYILLHTLRVMMVKERSD